jgi:hypothetical protein
VAAEDVTRVQDSGHVSLGLFGLTTAARRHSIPPVASSYAMNSTAAMGSAARAIPVAAETVDAFVRGARSPSTP